MDHPLTAALTLRTALLAERPALEALQWRASLNNSGDRDALLAHPDAIAIPPDQLTEGLVFVAEEAGALVGFAAILTRGDGDADLDALFVEPQLWRRGIGRALLQHCIEAARSRGAAALHVIGNPHAEAFYLGCGFAVIGVAQTQFGPGALMRKQL